MRLTIGGCDGQADTPDPIPNSEVKRPGGENTLTGKIAAAAFFVVIRTGLNRLVLFLL